MDKQELEDFLKYHDNLYYNLDSPELTDKEYDKYKDEYISKYGEYNYVPGIASDDFEKYNHTTYVSSLSKKQIKDEEGIRKEIERLWPVVIQPKMDGLTIVTYPGNIHVTRGNGHIGEIVTNNVKNADGLGIPFSAFPVRSELVMLHSSFNKINEEREKQGLKPYENCRNAAAGIIRNKDSTKVEGLKIFAYNLLFEEEDEENASAQTQINYLKNNEWNTVISYEPKDIDDAINYINSFDRKELDYDIDGLVVKHNGSKVFGQTQHHPLNAFAIKFEPEGAWTTIEDVQWTVGRTGKITPIAILNPVNIMGSTITKATLHNSKIINDLGLTSIDRIGKRGNSITEVYVIKANDVIPAILEVKKNNKIQSNLYTELIAEPKVCPICGSTLRKENDQLFCDNESCESRLLNKLIHLSQRDAFNIESLGEETCEKLISLWKNILNKAYNQIINSIEVCDEEDQYEDDPLQEIEDNIKNIHPSFIYNLSLEQIKTMEGFADKSAQKLYDEIQKSKELTFDRFLYGCGIPLVGKKVAKDIAEFYYSDKENEVNNFVDDYYNGFKRLINAKGIGNETIISLSKYYDKYIIPFGEYINIKDYIPVKKAKNQLIFVITGEFEISRNEIKKLIENAGHKVTNSVSSKTSYVLVGKDPGDKEKKAIEKNITIINSLEELKKIIEKM
jgi:DNA ligase (NAD+)